VNQPIHSLNHHGIAAQRQWLRRGWPGAVGTVALGLLLLYSQLGDELTNWSYDVLFRFRSSVPVEGVTILYMDLESMTAFGQQRRETWDRSLHAHLLDRLAPYQPKAVVFDVLFVENHAGALTNAELTAASGSLSEDAADTALVEAARRLGRVVVAAKPQRDFYEGELVSWQMTLPFQKLRDVSTYGVVEAADSDKSIREHYHRQDLDVPGIAWRAAQVAGTGAPADPFAERWLNYYGPPGWVRHYSYHELFQSKPGIPAAALSNQVVLVGALYDTGFVGGKRTDDFRTPYTAITKRRSPGVEVIATAYLNLVRNDWLRRPPGWVEGALILLGGVLAGFGLGACRPLLATGWALLGILFLGVVVVLLAWQKFVWFPWLIIAGAQIPAALAWSILDQTRRLLWEKRALEQTLAMAQAGMESPTSSPLPAAAGPVLPAPMPDAYRSPVRIGSSAARRSDEPRRREDGVRLPGEEPVPIPDHELLRCIGRGAYGEVWLARDAIGTYHAVKVVYRRSFSEDGPFEREFNGLRRFTPISRSHPGLVHVLHVGRNEAGGYLYYVMELGDDETSGQRIDPARYAPLTLSRVVHRQGRLALPECLRLGVQLADALQYLHQQQLIHRDIKPSNIIFVKGAPKFADIGLVTEVRSESGDVTYLGTKGYIAPEGPGTPGADVFSLGRVLYEAGYGMEPSRFPDLPTTMVENLEETGLFQLNNIVLKACETDPRRRYRTAAELQAALAVLLAQVAAKAAPGT